MVFESKCCQICGNLRNTKLDKFYGNICMNCNDEKIKNWKSDVFCCHSMELNYRDGHIETLVSWPDSNVGMVIETVFFYDDDDPTKEQIKNREYEIKRCSSIEYCPCCGFKITEEFVRMIAKRYNSINENR